MTGANSASSPPMGFAGLSALVTTLPPESAFAAPAPKPPPEASATNATVPVEANSSRPEFWTAGRIWSAVFMSAIMVVGILGMFAVEPPRAPSTASYSAPSSSYSSPQPAYKPAPVAPAREELESKPSITFGQTLGRSEIRYCLSEDVRLDAMRGYIDRTSETHINRFNAAISDYNARCANYRYRQTDMNAAKALVDASSAALRAQASTTVSQWR